MRQKSANRVTSLNRAAIPFENGDHMDQPTFHELYKQTPEGFKAELIGGVVYVASPTKSRHGRPHSRVVHWLCLYMDATPGTDVLDNTTTILDEESEPQPDACLLIRPEFGGQTKETEEGYVLGAAELVVEIAVSSAAIDLHRKKQDYEQAGVREYVVVLVEQREIQWFRRGKSGFKPVKPVEGIFRSHHFPGLWLDPESLFERSFQNLHSTLRAGLATAEHAAFVETLAKRAAKLAKRKRP